MQSHLFDKIKKQAELNEKDAIIFYGKKVTYSDLNIYINRLASYMQKEKQIKKGDKVAIFMQNSPQFIISYFDIQKIGAIVASCNPLLKKWELKHQLKELNPKILITFDNLYPVFKEIKDSLNFSDAIVSNFSDVLPKSPIPDFPEEVVSIANDYEITRFKDIILKHKSDNLFEVEVNEDDIALIIYTSGSTGLPKGAMLSHKNIEFKALNLKKTYNYDSSDTVLCAMPISHVAGMLVGVHGILLAGGTTLLMTRFIPSSTLEAIEEYKVNIIYTTPPMNKKMMEILHKKQFNLNSLRLNLGTSFGREITKQISYEWERYSGVELFEFSYGMTETFTGDTLMPPQSIKYGTFGQPNVETDIKIVSLNNREKELPVGEIGEITIKSPAVFKGYLNSPEKTKEVLKNGRFYTNDIGKIDNDGYLCFLDKKKEVIKSSGYSIFPTE